MNIEAWDLIVPINFDPIKTAVIHIEQPISLDFLRSIKTLSKLEMIPETELLPLLDRVMEAAMAKVETLTGVAIDSQSDSEERKMVDKSVSTLLALMTFWVREAVDPADKRGGEIIKKVNEWTGGHIRDRVGEKAVIFGHCF